MINRTYLTKERHIVTLPQTEEDQGLFKKTLGGVKTVDSDRFWVPLKINQAY